MQIATIGGNVHPRDEFLKVVCVSQPLQYSVHLFFQLLSTYTLSL